MSRWLGVVMLVCGTALIAAVTWLRPITIPADSYSAPSMDERRFNELKRRMISAKLKGVETRGQMEHSSVMLYCKGTPLISLIDAPGSKLLLVHWRFAERAPQTRALESLLVSEFRSSGAEFRPGKDHVGDVDKFVLKNRDGLDVDAVCDLK